MYSLDDQRNLFVGLIIIEMLPNGNEKYIFSSYKYLFTLVTFAFAIVHELKNYKLTSVWNISVLKDRQFSLIVGKFCNHIDSKSLQY
jgi:hypothetical protein